MKVLFLAAEAVPYVKVGGLGDVAGALPAALRRLGHEVRFIMPRYGLIDPRKYELRKLKDNFPVYMDWRREECQLWQNPATGDRFIENDYFFGSRFQVYGCGDEIEQFVLFCRAALEACRLEGWFPDIVHAHDWHTAAAIRLQWALPIRPGLVFTIHNLAHQGNHAPTAWPLLGVYDGRGGMNLMQQAIYCADVVTTVSPTYAQEIKGQEAGFGLDGMLRERSSHLFGVLNGIDMDSYNPATDQVIAKNFSVKDLAGKQECKRELNHRFGLMDNGGPIIGLVSRMDFQKGVELLVRGIYDIVHSSDANVVVVGSGDHGLEEQVRQACADYPGRIGSFIGFDPKLARKVYAGSDIFLMPSLFEPCGLSQLIAMRYGTLPVARATGGLVDTIVDCRVPGGNGTGYLFHSYNHYDMLGALGVAIDAYHNKRASWFAAMQRAMSSDFSWDKAAHRYSELYQVAKKY